MPGMLPGPLGLVAFSGVKFAGYTLAGTALRRAYTLDVSVLKIAFTRTLLGLAVGISHVVLWGAVLSNHVAQGMGPTFFVMGLIFLRLIIWTVVIWFFFDRKWERPMRIVAYAVAGTAFSFLLDIVGIALAFVTPGKTPFC